MIPRRIPLEALRAFESAARLKSFTAAAAELGLTQSAISQRVKALELSIGSPLFRRLIRSIDLTLEGERLFTALNSGFAKIAEALDGIERQRNATPIRLTVSASVATRWLLPRLGEIGKLRPKLAIEILADDRLLELGTEADIALRFGSGRYPGLRSTRFASDRVFPVCSRAFLESHPEAASFGNREGGQEWQLLLRLVDGSADSERCGCGWSDWAAEVGVVLAEPAAGLHFSHTHLAIEASARGMGICLARHLLVADLMASGELVKVGAAPPIPTRYSYYAVTAGPLPERLKSLNSWLGKAIAETLA